MLLNGRPVNLRLTHSGGDFPLTGSPATDVASWKKIIQVCQDYGLNGIRFHSWCPPEAAFTAADEMGFYLQPECGMWNDFGSPDMQQRLYDETARLLQAFGNHPSFILLSPSNEPRNYARFTPQWAAAQYAKDNRRLYSAGTGWSDPSQVSGNVQYATLVAFNRAQLRNTSGWFGRDYRAALENVHVPVLAHEVGQWCAYPDFDVIKKFTGFLRPGNYDIFKYIAEQQGVLDEDHAFAWASGRFQVECYKEEIEANLRTPGLSGFQLLDLHDYLGQGTALIGVVDAFWKPKSYVTRCGIPPLRRPDRSAGPARQPDFHQRPDSRIGGRNLSLRRKASRPRHTGVEDHRRLRQDGCRRPVGCSRHPHRQEHSPRQAFRGVVEACHTGGVQARGRTERHTGRERLEFLGLSRAGAALAPADVLVTNDWSAAVTRLAAGGKVLFLPEAADLDPARSPPMKNVPVFWNIQMTVRPPQNPRPRFDAMLGLLCDTNHLSLSEFPTEMNCDWQWTKLVNNVRSVNLANAPRSLRPIVAAIDDWNRNWRLGVIFECNVGPGRLLVSAINLNAEHSDVELLQLRRSLLDYMAGSHFKPTATLTTEQARSLWMERSAATAPAAPARTFDPDLNDGSTPRPAPAQR